MYSIFNNYSVFYDNNIEYYNDNLYVLVFVCHDETNTYKCLEKYPNSYVIFVGFGELSKIDSRIIIARDLKDNIEYNKKLLTFTAWYLIVKNYLFMEYTYLCIFEYDVLLSPSFDISLNNLLKNKENCAIGFIYDNIAFLRDVNQSLLKSLFPNLYISSDIKWYSTSNFCITHNILKDFVEWYLLKIPIISNYDLAHLSWYHERLFNVFMWEKQYTFNYLPNILEHYFLNSHNIINN